jgi:hypothetical protein
VISNTKVLLILSICFFGLNLYASFDYSAQIGTRYKHFEDDDLDFTQDYQLDLKTKFQADYENDFFRLHMGFFSRIDQNNSQRNIINFDEFYLKKEFESSSWSIGNHVFNWSVLEIFHPVDTINSKNFDSNGDLTERLGQPSLIYHKDFESSFFEIILFLANQKSILPDRGNRNGAKVEFEEAKYVNKSQDISSTPNMLEYVLRYQVSFDNVDLDLHYARKYDTNNPLISTPKTTNTSPTLEDLDITPYYLKVSQYGLTAQYNLDAFLIKFETVYFDFDQDTVTLFIPPITDIQNTKEDFNITALGVERSVNYSNDTEGTYFFEYQSIFGTTIEDARILSPFQRDAAIGYRHNFNDFNGNEIIAVLINDVDRYEERIYSISHSRRFFDSWKIESNLRIIEADNPSPGLDISNFEGLRSIANGDSFTLELTKFF